MPNDRFATAPASFVDADGIRFACRRFGATDGVPLVFLQHFTGTMDGWDPSVVDGFARMRPVVLFDNAGVSRSSGETPDSVRAMAGHAVAFIAALGLTRVDLLGFSLGGFVAQVIAAQHSELVRRIILVGTGPDGGIRADGDQPARRPSIHGATGAPYDRLASSVSWGKSPDSEGAPRMGTITQPVLVVNGKNDVLVPTINSYTLFQQLPDARLLLYPDSGHGALFQYAEEFVREGLRFLDC